MNWDKYFLDICKVVGTNSKCLSRQIGSVMVKDKSIISSGYNGPARGIPSCSERYLIDNPLREALKDKGIDPDNCDHKVCPRRTLGFKSGEGLEWCIAAHSERNCLINAARNGIHTRDTTLYMDCNIPCKECLTEIINAGVSEVVCTERTFYDIMSKFLIKNSELRVRTFHLENSYI